MVTDPGCAPAAWLTPKTADVPPAGMVTEAGMRTTVLEAESCTVAPPDGAGAPSNTVPDVD
jgi:hypothetical protein